MRIGVIGAGISGLTTAYELEKRGVEVAVFEAAERVGGPMASERHDGWLAEMGPHSLMESNPELPRIIAELGLEEQRVYASETARKRFLVQGGEVKALPTSPPAFLRSDIYSGRAKLRLLGEAFVPPRDDGADESVSSFVRRRIGDEFLDYGVALLVNGIWAGDPDKLSIRYAFQKMHALEANYGSLIRGAIGRMLSGAPRPAPSRMFSFVDGNGTLARALGEALSDLRLQAKVTSLDRGDEGWTVTSTTAGKTSSDTFDQIVVCLPPRALEELEIEGKAPSFAADITTPTVAVVSLGFRREQVDHPLDGFGMLMPPTEKMRILGTLFSSSLFPGRAPEGHVLLATFVGGARTPEYARLEPDARRQMVLEELGRTLGVRGEPSFECQKLWTSAIPQYELGYGRALVAMQALEKTHPGLHLGGNTLDGIAVPDLIKAAVARAERLAAAPASAEEGV